MGVLLPTGTTTPFTLAKRSPRISPIQRRIHVCVGVKGVNRERPRGRPFPPTLGLHDVHGNVFNGAGLVQRQLASDAVDPQGPEKGELRVLRAARGTRFRLLPLGESLRVAPSYRDNLCGLRVCFSWSEAGTRKGVRTLIGAEKSVTRFH